MYYAKITFSNGDIEKCCCNFSGDDPLSNLLSSEFGIAWHHRDAEGRITKVTNMKHVRSVELIDEVEFDQLEA